MTKKATNSNKEVKRDAAKLQKRQHRSHGKKQLSKKGDLTKKNDK